MTRAELTENVMLRLGVSSSDTQMRDYVRSLLNSEYIRLAAEENLLEKVGTLTLVSGSPVVDLPNDWQRTIQITEGGHVLRPVTAVEYTEASASPGQYRVYYPESPERILVAPTSNISDPDGLGIIYVARPAELTTDSSVPTALPVEYHDLLPELVLMRAFLAEEDVTLAQGAQMNAQGLLDRLRAHRNVQSGNGIGKMILPPVAARYGRSWR
jgi:hypothetical protein